jgi:hypothetical protein
MFNRKKIRDLECQLDAAEKAADYYATGCSEWQRKYNRAASRQKSDPSKGDYIFIYVMILLAGIGFWTVVGWIVNAF